MRFIVVSCALLIFTICAKKTFCDNTTPPTKDDYAKIRKLVAQKALLENNPYSDPTTRLFNWDLSTATTPTKEITTADPRNTANDKINEIKTSRKGRIRAKNKRRRRNRKNSSEPINLESTTSTVSRPKRRRGKCNRNSTRRRCKKRRQKEQLPNILEVTTARNKKVFRLNAQNNATINELIMKLNENPEYDYSKLLSQKNTIEITTTDNYDISRITVDTPSPEVTEMSTTPENNDVLINLQFTTLRPHRNFTFDDSNNEVDDFYEEKRKKYKHYGDARKSRCTFQNGGCSHICHNYGAKRCSCLKGFYLDSNGRNCFDVDECSVRNGGCQKECRNTFGSYYCDCPQGFRLADDFKSCEDINECLLRNGHGPCQDTCINTLGSYKCDCGGIKGTRLGEDGHTCLDVNECSESNGGCSHTCINTLGRAFCTCPLGLELGFDWKTCHDIDECKDEEVKMECPYGCINTMGSYQCVNPGDFQNDQSVEVHPTPDHIVCPPLFPPTHGFLKCSREKAHAVKLRTRSGRTRITNRPGTLCYLICPFGYRSVGKYHLTCGVDGKWFGTNKGKCLPFSKPVITCPRNYLYYLDNGADNINVTFPKPSSNINWKYVTSKPQWAKNLSANLSEGRYLVTFTAVDPETKIQTSCSFNITVEK